MSDRTAHQSISPDLVHEIAVEAVRKAMARVAGDASMKRAAART